MRNEKRAGSMSGKKDRGYLSKKGGKAEHQGGLVTAPRGKQNKEADR